eukprot:scaffold71756_cov32-Prasinocladus_malaysianus.AAC.2
MPDWPACLADVRGIPGRHHRGVKVDVAERVEEGGEPLHVALPAVMPGCALGPAGAPVGNPRDLREHPG